VIFKKNMKKFILIKIILFLVLTFARVFTNCATTVAYQRIFCALFNLIFQLTGSMP
jgi:hypothetical protein